MRWGSGRSALKTLGDQIGARRLDLGLRQSDVAKLLGGRSNLGDWALHTAVGGSQASAGSHRSAMLFGTGADLALKLLLAVKRVFPPNSPPNVRDPS